MSRSVIWVAGVIALIDLAIGGTAVFSPDTFSRIVHGVSIRDLFLVQRTGVIWLFFSGVAAFVCFWGRQFPSAIFLLSMLHFMDAPADALYRFTSSTLSPIGRVTLTVMPFLNLV